MPDATVSPARTSSASQGDRHATKAGPHSEARRQSQPSCTVELMPRYPAPSPLGAAQNQPSFWPTPARCASPTRRPLHGALRYPPRYQAQHDTSFRCCDIPRRVSPSRGFRLRWARPSPPAPTGIDGFRFAAVRSSQSPSISSNLVRCSIGFDWCCISRSISRHLRRSGVTGGSPRSSLVLRL